MIVFEKIKSFFQKVFRKMTPGIWLILVVVLSLASLFFQYFRREGSLSVAEIAGSVIVPFQKGVNEIGSFLSGPSRIGSPLMKRKKRSRIFRTKTIFCSFGSTNYRSSLPKTKSFGSCLPPRSGSVLTRSNRPRSSETTGSTSFRALRSTEALRTALNST